MVNRGMLPGDTQLSVISRARSISCQVRSGFELSENKSAREDSEDHVGWDLVP